MLSLLSKYLGFKKSDEYLTPSRKYILSQRELPLTDLTGIVLNPKGLDVSDLRLIENKLHQTYIDSIGSGNFEFTGHYRLPSEVSPVEVGNNILPYIEILNSHGMITKFESFYGRKKNNKPNDEKSNPEPWEFIGGSIISGHRGTFDKDVMEGGACVIYVWQGNWDTKKILYSKLPKHNNFLGQVSKLIK